MTSDVRSDVYKETGVDTAEADAGLNHIIARVQGTWPRAGLGRVVLPIGYFANVIELDGVGLALCTDGVGSKTMIADMMGKYDTIGIDCVAMNVNDVICVGAKPLSMVDYIAVERTDAAMLDAIGAGLCKGAEQAQISISGGETAQLKDVINGFDLVGMAVGRVALDRVIDGGGVRGGDVVIGVRSNGVHSNGLSLARKAFFEDHRYAIDRRFDELGSTIGEELLRPTDIYVREAMEILAKVRGVKALANITGDGLLNLLRVAAPVGYVIDASDRAAPDLSADPTARQGRRLGDVRGVQHGHRLLLRGRSGRRRAHLGDPRAAWARGAAHRPRHRRPRQGDAHSAARPRRPPQAVLARGSGDAAGGVIPALSGRALTAWAPGAHKGRPYTSPCCRLVGATLVVARPRTEFRLSFPMLGQFRTESYGDS